MLFKDFGENLEFQLLMSELDEVVHNFKEGKIEFEDYLKHKRLIVLYLDCIAGNCKILDWKWLFDNRCLCIMDFEWFGKFLSEYNLFLEQYKRNF